MEEAQTVHKEMLDKITHQKQIAADMNTVNNYKVEAFNISNGRTLEVALVRDTDETRALDSALLSQGYRSYIPFYGGHPFVRQPGLLRSTSGGQWQLLQAPHLDKPKGPNATAASNSTIGKPQVQIASVKSTWPINEASLLRGDRKNSIIPSFHPIDDRGQGPKRVLWQIRSGSGSGEHLDSLGRPTMRAFIVDREHYPVTVWGDALPVNDSPTIQMRYSFPMTKPLNISQANSTRPFNISNPSAGLVESDSPVSISETFVTDIRVDPDKFYKSAHGFRFGAALYIIDGVP
jgi:hypothetical protein